MKQNNCKTRAGSRARSRLASVLTVLALLLMAATGAWAQTETYTVRMKKGTKDADKWTVTPAEATTTGVAKDTPVSLTYGGRLKVKDVTAKIAPIDLSELTEDYTAKNGDVLTGTLDGETQPYKITIADGATVTLAGVTINGVDSESYEWAGLTCEGSATIILKHGSTNTVKGFHKYYPGIFVPSGSSLIIKGEAAGTGALTASPFNGGGDDSYGAGIGGEYDSDCGNIEIQGGNITATGGFDSAGIGAGRRAVCGTITISGGTITAKGGGYAAGIGSGYDGSSCDGITISGGSITATGGNRAAGIGSGSSSGISGDPISSCGTISITTGVTKVTATKGTGAPNSIGAGYNSKCGKVTIGCTLDGGNPVGGKVYWDGSDYQSDGDTYLRQATITYEPSN